MSQLKQHHKIRRKYLAPGSFPSAISLDCQKQCEREVIVIASCQKFSYFPVNLPKIYHYFGLSSQRHYRPTLVTLHNHPFLMVLNTVARSATAKKEWKNGRFIFNKTFEIAVCNLITLFLPDSQSSYQFSLFGTSVCLVCALQNWNHGQDKDFTCTP